MQNNTSSSSTLFSSKQEQHQKRAKLSSRHHQDQQACFNTENKIDEDESLMSTRSSMHKMSKKNSDENFRLKHSFNDTKTIGKVDLNTNENRYDRLMLTTNIVNAPAPPPPTPVETPVVAEETRSNKQERAKTTITSSTTKRNNSLTNYNTINNSIKSMKSTRLTESDSDTETQNRLLAKASGSIPIEYISIRRDPKPTEKQVNQKSASITTGTNTIVERGKRIAATNTEEAEIPKYNLHLSLDSLIKRNEKREVSTSTERVKFVNKSAATETERKKDACTLTSDGESDSEAIQIPIQEIMQPPAPPPPQPQVQQHFSYRSRRARYEWDTRSSPGIRDEYRLEFLAKSPRTLRRKQHVQNHQTHKYMALEDETDASDAEYATSRQRNVIQKNRKKFDEICIDDDDRLIFGESYVQQQNHHSRHESRHESHHRSGSYPTVTRVPIIPVNDDLVTTRRYIRKTKTYTPHQQQQYINNNQYQIGIMPLKSTENLVNTDGFSSCFKEMHAKFNEIFSSTNQEFNVQNNVQTFYEPGGMNRLVFREFVLLIEILLILLTSIFKVL